MSAASSYPALLCALLLACGGTQGPRDVPEGLGPWGERTDLRRAFVPLDDRPRRGAEAPLVELVVFADYACEHCFANEANVRRLRESHPGSLRVHHRHLPLPFHEHAEGAAQAAEASRAQGGDDAFWRMHDQLFAHTAELGPEQLLAHAAAVGLDAARVREDLATQRHAARVEQDVELADRVGADGAPTLFFNGRPVYGALPYAELDQILSEEIALARAALGQGIPREALYAVAMRNAERSDAPAAREPRPRGPRQRLDRSVTYAVPTDGAPSIGGPDALVTVVMFSDFQCPFCAQAMPTMAALLERHPDDLRLVYRHNPIPSHRDAFGAAEAAAEAYAQGGDAAFWRMHDRLLASPRALARGDLLTYAAELGLDVDRFAEAIDRGVHEEAIESDRELAQRLGARVTPSFFVNGRLITGAQPLGVFIDLVDEQLEGARERVAAGTPRGEVYAALMEGAESSAVWTSAEPPSVVTLSVPERAPRRGATEPTIVVQMFSDFECPYCRLAMPTLTRLLEEHPEVQLAYRHYPLPFHRDARPTALAAVEVQRQLGDEAFWTFHDRALAARSLDPDSLVAIAAEVGADGDEVRAAIAEERHADVIDADLAQVRDAGLRIGTPAFLVGNRLVMGAQPYEVFERALAEATPATPN